MATVKIFEDLEIWKLSRILCNDINIVANNTELKKDYRLYNQIDGSSGSVMIILQKDLKEMEIKNLSNFYQ